MLTNECWFGGHDVCSEPAYCDCLCHATLDFEEWEGLEASWYEEGPA